MFALCAYADEASLSVDIYPLQQRYENDTQLINMVPNLPKSIAGINSCLPPNMQLDINDLACPSVWREYMKECEEPLERAVMSVVSESYPPVIKFVPIYGNKGVAMYLEDRHEGNGGAETYWQLYVIQRTANASKSCPYKPSLSGVKMTAGGLVWQKTYCKRGEDFHACVSRVLFPSKHATRLKFDAKQTISTAIPKADQLNRVNKP